MKSRSGTKSLCMLALSIGVIYGCSPASDSDRHDPVESRTSGGLKSTGDKEATKDEVASNFAGAEPENPSLAPGIAPARASNASNLIEELQSFSWEKPGEPDPTAANLLGRLRQQGVDAVIPIRDFLLDRDAADSSTRELRLALLDVLLSLRLPEVEGIALELLGSGVSAVEAWRLGQYLESVEPGKYIDSIRTATEKALIESEPAADLPGEFFSFLASLGNEETALLLAGLPEHEEVYGRLALASIPDGGGIPILEQDARVFETGRDTVQGRLAIQLLAQQAPRHSEAAAVLLDLARQGVIPHDLWPYVLDIVAGSWELTLSEPAAASLVGSHTYYDPEGDQVIYRAALDPELNGDEFQSERLFLLESLQPFVPADLRPDGDG